MEVYSWEWFRRDSLANEIFEMPWREVTFGQAEME